MKQSRLIRLAVVCAIMIGMLPVVRAQETVTIPKARFEELERKEKELDQLKGELSAARGETVRLKKEKDAAVAQAAAAVAAAPGEPVLAHVSPPMGTLPPLGKGDTVDALDLANHFRADAAAAAARYRNKTFKVKGEITGFDKPLLTRNYHVLLRTADRQMRVLCVVTPPEQYSAAFTVKGGTQFVGAFPSGARVTLAQVGDTVIVEGRCRGLDGLVVEMSGCSLQSAP